MDYSRDFDYLDAAQVEAWKVEYTVIARMLHGLLQKWKIALLLISDFRLLVSGPLAFGEWVTAYLLYNGSAS